MKPRTYLWIIFRVSLAATIGSLYYGYFGDPLENFVTGDLFNTANALAPCALCRYIRIFQYPILLISAIALRKKDYHSIMYIWPLALIGLLFSLYKYALEMGRVMDEGFCTIGGAASCNSAAVMYGGFITLAWLGAIAFVIIILASLLLHKRHLSSQ